MNKKIGLRVAYIDPRSWYSPNLVKSLRILHPTLAAYIYLSKWSEDTPIKKIYYNSSIAAKKECNSSVVWSKYSYPFDIVKKAVSDHVNIVHVQWEFNVFGVFYASLLLPLLLLFLRIVRVKCVVTVHSVIPRASFGLNLPGFTLPRCINIFVQLLFVMLYRLIVLLSDAIIVHGESLKELLCTDYKSEREKIFAIPYGITSKVEPVFFSDKVNKILSDYKEIILSFGTISPRKGLDVLIKAFEKLSLQHPSWVLVISGNVPSYYEHYYSYLQKLASKLIKQNKVIFLGSFNISELASLLKASKVVVFPYRYNFGASSTLTFALQHRKVIVISSLSFATDLLTDGENSILIPPENPDLLAKSIERAMCNSRLRNSLQKGITDLLERSSWNFTANETLKIYKKVLSGKINY